MSYVLNSAPSRKHLRLAVLAMNRRKQSSQLTTSQIQKLRDAHDRAIEIGLPLNVFASVDSPDRQGTDHALTAQIFRTFKNHLGQFGRRLGFPVAYAWVAEAGKPDGRDPHQHFLIHIPPPYYKRFHDIAHGWLPGANAVDVKPVDNMPGLLDYYLIKQSEEHGQTGIFIGKRFGVSKLLRPSSMVYPIKSYRPLTAALSAPQQNSVF